MLFLLSALEKQSQSMTTIGSTAYQKSFRSLEIVKLKTKAILSASLLRNHRNNTSHDCFTLIIFPDEFIHIKESKLLLSVQNIFIGFDVLVYK